MLSKENNELLTRVGPRTPGGELLRRYWQPAALAEELPAGGSPLALRLLAEDLVLFRDGAGYPALLGLHCSHRAADLSYGRLEDGGLRCLYHGWLYDRHGTCLEQPGEPAGSDFKSKIRHPAYPCQEVGGLIFAYLGPGDPPLLPAYEPFSVPDSHRNVTKFYEDCNYLQGNEGNIDPAHLSFLHRFMSEDEALSRQSGRPANGNISSNVLFGRDTAPRLEIEETDFGVRIYSVRDATENNRYVRISNFLMPSASAIPAGQGTGGGGYQINWHVPIDDTHHWRYSISFQRSGPLDKDRLKQVQASTLTPAYHLLRNKANRYQQDREEMRSQSFSGLGPVFIVHDTYAIEGEGPVQDRSREHLGTTDIAIAASRQMLLRAIRDVQEGADPPHVIRELSANDLRQIVVVDELIPASADWHTYWREQAEAESSTR